MNCEICEKPLPVLTAKQMAARFGKNHVCSEECFKADQAKWEVIRRESRKTVRPVLDPRIKPTMTPDDINDLYRELRTFGEEEWPSAFRLTPKAFVEVRSQL